MDLLGRVLDSRYRLDAKLGTGGSARVYAARDLVLQRDVAVKVLHPALADDQRFLRRFEAEARSAASLQHPGIVAIHDFGSDGVVFMVLELVGGGSLQDLLDEARTLSPSSAARIGSEVCAALACAHDRGIVHRDIKPGNILLAPDGSAKVADFGLARALAEASWTEPLHSVLGTARYAPPEVLDGRATSPAGDLYSLGLVLAEVVSGEPVFAADTPVAVLAGRLRGSPALPPALGSLAPVLSVATSAEPAERFPSAAAMRAELAPLAGHEVVVPARRPIGTGGDPTEEVPRPRPALDVLPAIRRRRWRPRLTRRLAAVLLVVALVAAAVPLWLFALGAGTVTDVRGLDLATARSTLEGAGLSVAIGAPVPDYEVPEGSVVGTVPGPGSKVRWRGPVQLVPSTGLPLVGIPEVTSRLLDDAVRSLFAAGLRPGGITSRADPASMTTVVEVLSKGPLRAGSPVDLVVSAGPPPVAVPAVADREAAEADAALRAAGFSVVVTEEFHDEVEAGRVIEQDPAAGARARTGSTVAIVVSNGPDVVQVPDVRGQPVAQAVTALEAAGLQVQISPVTTAQEFALTTEPQRGSTVKRGSTVILYTI